MSRIYAIAIAMAALTHVASAQLAPTVTKTFDPNDVWVGETTKLTLTLTNPTAAITLTNISVSDTLPLAKFQFQNL